MAMMSRRRRSLELQRSLLCSLAAQEYQHRGRRNGKFVIAAFCY
jgi:hypothetical protein